MGTLKTRCVIIGGGDCSVDFLKGNINPENDYVICADSGYDYAVSAGLTPDLLIGDFDSISVVPQNMNKITLPIEKDVTDCVAAYNEGIKIGFRNFVLFGGTGGRFEHTFANISLMANASLKNIDFKMVDEMHTFRCITDSFVRIPYRANQQISVFAFGGIADGVTLNGFHYPLKDFTLDSFNGAFSTSNDITDEFGEITVKSGTLVIVETIL